MHYVMVMRDDRFWLIGPFASEAQASAWGHTKAHNPDDDPRWQTIKLVDPHAPVEVRAPSVMV